MRRVRVALKLPRCFEGVLNTTSVASGQVSDDHHVLYVLAGIRNR
jgi:hypothetical protein